METALTEPRQASAAQSDTDAYDARFTAWRPRLVRICAGFVGADTAEDVVQDAYLRGRARRGQLRDEDLFEAWITRLAINLCFDRGRSLRRFVPWLAGIARREPRAGVGRDVGLRDLIEQLPARDRTLVVLHYGYGYSMEEIARMTGLSAVNVRTLVFRARRKLRDRLEEDR